MKLQDIFEADEPKNKGGRPKGSKTKPQLPPYPPAVGPNGNWDFAHDDRRPGHTKLRKERAAERQEISDAFRAQVVQSIGPVVEQLKSQYPAFAGLEHYNLHAKGRWKLYVPVDAIDSVHQTLLSTLSQISGKASPSYEGSSTFGNAWDSIDFDFGYNGVNASVGMQWKDVQQRNSTAAHLNFPAFRVYGIGFSLGDGWSDISGRNHSGQ